MKAKIKLEQRKGKYFYKVVNGVRTRIEKKADYLRLRGQSVKLITKKGKILNEKLLARLEKQYGKAEVNIVLKDIMKTPGEVATYKYVKARLTASKLDKMFINLGRSPEELAAELGIEVEAVKDEENWKDGKFHSTDGKIYELKFNYEGNSFEEVKADE